MSDEERNHMLEVTVTNHSDKLFDDLYACCRENDIPTHEMEIAMEFTLGDDMARFFRQHVTSIERQGRQS